MPSSPFKTKSFHLSSLDRELLDPDHGGLQDISWWYKAYFDGELYPWQHYFYHHPAKDKLVVAGIRSGKSYGAAVGLLHFPFYHPYARCLNTSISSEQAKIVFHTMLDLCSRERFKHWVEHIEKSPYPLIRLVNGSEIWFRSVGYEAELLRGFEFDLINIDEAAYIQSRMTIDTLRGRLLGVNPRTQEPRAGLLWQTRAPRASGW